MTQTQPAYQYGRHNQGYGGGYPPQAAPPQQELQRYYTPNPQQGMLCTIMMTPISANNLE